MSRRRPASRRPVLSRRAPSPVAGVLPAIASIGRALAYCGASGRPISSENCLALAADLRIIYRVVRSLAPPA